MSFVQIEFVWFMLLVFVLHYAARTKTWQNLLLVVASYVFYGWIHPWFCLLLLTSSVIDFFAAQGMQKAEQGKKKWWLALSFAGNLGMLGYFKYMNWFVDSVIYSLNTLGIEHSVAALNIYLPVGISFFTFQTMSYTIDIYRGQLEARKNFIDYMVFVSFFPQLVAGPVERASNVLPQLEKRRSLDWGNVRSGLGLAMWGAFKKVVVADTIAPYVDLVFIHNEPSGAMVWAAALGFTIQILADFSAYTDLARGTARMLGIELMENFKSPYVAQTPMEYWQRWHISFSTWLRDYVYLPVTFSDWARTRLLPFGKGPGPMGILFRAFMITMVISGLWHGASWSCVIWGLYHGLLLTVYTWAQRKIPRKVRKKKHWKYLLTPLMFFWTVLGMLIFREPRTSFLLQKLSLNPFVGTEDQWIAASVMLSVSLVGAVPLLLAYAGLRWVKPRIESSPWYWPIQTTGWTVYAVAMFTFVRITDTDFVYFQF
jgi:D-alanyl-lipoteichoic acid acyltransferase DltB (MBOAT superfamily)